MARYLKLQECFPLHTGEVVGSIPTAPTIKSPVFPDISRVASPAYSASDGRTKREDDAATRGKSVDSVR